MRVCLPLRAILLTTLALAGCDDKDAPAASNTAAPATAPAAQPAPPAATPAAAPATTPPPAAPAAAPPAPSQAVFTPEQLDQMMAPLALYPDSLLAQVLMAATYPGDVADAAAWSKAHPNAKGDDAVRQVANQPWDPSVQSLVAFPDVLVLLGKDPGWVQRVGDAFLASPNSVMDSVQRLRRQAKAAGNLESNDKQTVTVQEAPPAPPPAASSDTTVVVQQPAPAQTIVIQPTDPQVVYVPSYNPNTAYGTWPYPASPPVYYPPPPGAYMGTALLSGLAFGAGVAIVGSLWGDCDWGRGDVDINVNRYNNINTNRQLQANQNRFQHNPQFRNGVPYRDSASQQRYSQRLANSGQRDAFRGYDQQRTAERARASQSLQQRGIAAPATSNREAVQRAETAGRDIRNDPQARQRAQATMQDRQRADASQQLRQRQASGQDRQFARDGSHQRQTSQRNLQTREQARQQNASANRGPRNNAFAGSRSPSQTRANMDRGRSSQLSASRPQKVSSGRQISRPTPSRSGGGGFRRR